MTKKLYVFLRHNNDIDHITPVVWKWLKTTDIPVDILLVSDKKYIYDYRLNLLKKMGKVTITHINCLYLFFYKKYYQRMDRYTNRYNYIRNKVDHVIKNIADQVFNSEDGVVVFDWVMNYFTNSMIQHAHRHGYKVLSLPHGDAPYINELETIDELGYDGFDRRRCFNVFDYIIVPNWITGRRYKKHVDDGKVKMLGSCRYCDEWMDFYDKHLICYPNKHTGLRVVMFLRNQCYPVDWDEVGRSIKMILNHPNVYLVVKGHARSRNSDIVINRLLNKYPMFKNLGNICFVYGDCNPSSLLRWCDIVVDIGTSMTWEAVKKNIPVLCMDYLHCNKSTVGYYMENCLMDCRDKFYNTLSRLVGGMNSFYNMDARNTFLREVVDYPDKDVLGRYVNIINSCYKE